MLRKLLKYEFKASGRILLPIYGALVLLGAVSGIFTGINPELTWDNRFLSLLQVLLIVIYSALFAASAIFAVIISIIRFKKNLLGSEGYLMHTLPVTASSNIAAKLIVSMCYQILSVVTAFVSIFMFILSTWIVCGGIQNFTTSDINDILIAWDQIKSMLTAQMATNFAFYALETVILSLAAIAGFDLMIYAAMSIGYSFNSNKTAKSVLTYIGFYVATQIINLFLIRIFYPVASNIPSGYAAPHAFFLGLTVLYLVYAIVYFFITNYFLKNKLNLQ